MLKFQYNPERRTSKNTTPEPTPRLTIRNSSRLENSSDYYGSSASLNAALGGQRELFQRHHDVRGSTNSLSSSGTVKGRKSKKAPAPPPPKPPRELFPTTEAKKELLPDLESKKSSPCSSNSATPLQSRKKRPAPKPPSSATVISNTEMKYGDSGISTVDSCTNTEEATCTEVEELPKIEIDKLSDEEKAAHLENIKIDAPNKQRVIALDCSLVGDMDEDAKEFMPNESQTSIQNGTDESMDSITFRRKIHAPQELTTPIKDLPFSSLFNTSVLETHDRQLEKLKDNKEAKNRNRQSQVSNEDTCSLNSDPLLNKSIHGKWKRRKGPAPSLPVPPKKVLQMLPLQEIRHELEIIEVQQQGLEKQGVCLEKMIRERCEGKNGELNDENVVQKPNSKEVEDLILQLFELVNEKNELFRRQAELMYLRRQHRLEQEQADLEYEIRVLMAQPERNKTDSDKAREEALISRLVEVVQLRNEVIECLEMDRLREAEEDQSIKQRLEMHTAKRDEEMSKQQTLTKLSKKEKKKQKEIKKLGKSKKLDADKDADESELNVEDKQKLKKKKKKFLFGRL